MPGSLFLLLALELMALVAVATLWVIALEAEPQLIAAPDVARWWPWAAIQVAALAIAAAAVWAAAGYIRNRWTSHAMLMLAAALICGLVFLGSLGVQAVATGAVDPVAVGEAELERRRLEAALAPRPDEPDDWVDEPAPAAPPDPAAGRRPYMASCASCHGPRGEGVRAIGPALVETDFMQQSSDDQVLQVIIQGRMPGDPDSVMNMPMPPRGGNPRLTDAQARDIVAYLRSLDEDEPADDAVVTDPEEMLPRWTVPPAEAAPAGLAPEARALRPDAPGIAAVSPEPPPGPGLVVALFAALGALHIVAAMGIASWMMARIADGDVDDGRLTGMNRAARLYWAAAAVAWVVALPLLYLA